jgi:RNA recognition motif-containing protein
MDKQWNALTLFIFKPGAQRKFEMKIVIGNLDPQCTKEDLRALFETYGAVEGSEVIPVNRAESRGKVWMTNDPEALTAISRLDGSTFQGRVITVEQYISRT